MQKPRRSLVVSLVIHTIALAATLVWAAISLGDPNELRELRVELDIEEQVVPREEIEEEEVEKEDPIEDESFEEPEEILPEVEPDPTPEPDCIEPPPPDRRTHWTELRKDLMRRTKPKPKPKPKPTPKPKPKPEPTPVVVRAPEAVPGKNKPPGYPKLAERRRWQGTVTLSIEVDKNGKVQQCTVAESSGYKILDDAAIAAVKEWVFRYGPGKTSLQIQFARAPAP